MLQKWMALFLAAVLAAVVGGCSAVPTENNDEEDSNEYYNGYLDLKVTVPDGWQVTGRNSSAMTVYQGDSMKINTMTKNSYGDGNFYLDLIEMSNMEDPADDNYIRIHLFAENYRLTFPSLSEYISASKNAYAGVQDGDYYSALQTTRTERLGQRTYHRLRYLATGQGEQPSYCQEYNICEAGEIYPTVYAQYWDSNEESKRLVDQVVSSLRFGASAEPPAAINTEPVPPEDDTAILPRRTYYNEYLQLVVTVPEGFSEIRDDDNLSEQAAAISNLGQMSLQDYSDGGHYYDLIRIQNSPVRGTAEFAQLDLFVEEYDAFASYEHYIEAAEKAYGGNGKEMTSREQETIRGYEYDVLTFYSQYGGYNSSPQYDKYYIRQIGDLYFVAGLHYLENSDKSINDADTMLADAFVFAEPAGETV